MSRLLVAPLEALTDPDLTDQERRVLLALFSFRGKVSETVWPSREKIGERANMKDMAAIGKRTTALCKKGWLVKYKKGFSGHMMYTFAYPARLIPCEETPTLSMEVESTFNDETPASSMEVKSTSNGEMPTPSMEVESTSNGEMPSLSQEVELTSHTRCNSPPHTRCNPPSADNKPIEHTTEQTTYKKISLECNDPLIDLYKHFIDHRIEKKDRLSQHKFELYLKSVQRCVDKLNVTPKFVIEKTIEAGWKSVEPSWLTSRGSTNRAVIGKTNSQPSIRQGPIDDALTDGSWAN